MTKPAFDASLTGNIRVLGIDPGFASIGLAILQIGPGSSEPVALFAECFRTKKETVKNMRGLRVSTDDERRLREIWAAIDQCVEVWGPTVVAVEAYRPFKAAGAAWKVAKVCGAIEAYVCSKKSMSLFSYAPQDVKRGVADNISASKDDVAAKLYAKIPTFRSLMAKTPKTLHEHVTDAGALAWLAIAEIRVLRKQLGLGDL